MLENVREGASEVLATGSTALRGRRRRPPAAAGATRGSFAVAELPGPASQNYLQLQRELVDTEDEIQASRRFYNGGTRELNIKIRAVARRPVLARLDFEERDFFEADDAAALRRPAARAVLIVVRRHGAGIRMGGGRRRQATRSVRGAPRAAEPAQVELPVRSQVPRPTPDQPPRTVAPARDRRRRRAASGW